MIKIPNLTPEMVKLTEIIHYDKNAKKHPDEQISKIANSIKEFGFRQPIILNNPKDKVIVCGHGRIFAANKLDMKEVPVLYADDMTEAQIKAFRIADNRITESEWDFDLLKLDFEGMTEQEINLTGFEFDELSAINDYNAEVRDVEPDNPEEIKTDIQKGDLFELGNHRLLCGDATSEEDVKNLMGSEKADMIFTDPPYSVNYEKKRKEIFNDNSYNKIENDDLSVNEISEKVWRPSFKNMYFVSEKHCSFYITMPQGGDQMMMMMMMMMSEHWKVKHEIIWLKENAVFSMGRLDYDYKHEPIMYGWKNTHEFYGGGTYKSSIWEIKRNKETKIHPTMKPVELIVNAVQNSSKINDNILDLFGGSGSTLIACEQTNRTCFIMEIDPLYCQVIINRWEKLTGKKAQKI